MELLFSKMSGNHEQGVSSHGEPGKVMELHFLFPGLEKSWNLTLGFGKFLKVMEIIRHPLKKPCCAVPLLNPAHQLRDLEMSSKRNFFITFYE